MTPKTCEFCGKAPSTVEVPAGQVVMGLCKSCSERWYRGDAEAAEMELQYVLAHADDPRAPDPDAPIRFSRLKLFSKSPAHFAAALEDEASHLDVGAAAHSLILGGQTVIAYPGKVRRGKEWDAFALENEGALILTKREFGQANRMAKAVRGNPDAMAVLEGEREKTLYWEVQGRKCRGTPDVRNEEKGFITELKTGETSDPRFFPFKVRRFCYHGQLAWYSDGAVLCGLNDPRAQYVVAVEATYPHVVTVFDLTDEIDKGRRLVRLWFERLLQCEAAKAWPGYSQSIVKLVLPEDNFEMLDADEVAQARPDWADAAAPEIT